MMVVRDLIMLMMFILMIGRGGDDDDHYNVMVINRGYYTVARTYI